MRHIWTKLAAVAVAAVALSACNESMDRVKNPAETAQNAKAGQDFLTTIAKQPGVVTLPNGLMYKVVSDPTPAAPKPAATDTVKVHYEGKLVDGTTFDSSFARGVPAVFALNQVVEAWQVGIPLMHKGDTYMLYVPPKLGYGDQATPDGMIPADSVLIFKVQLLDIMGR